MADNQSLIASQNSPGFAQQGQLDWLAIARTPVAFTLDVLARYGRAGVEPVTVTMGRAVCFGFDLRPETQKQLEESRSKLKTISSYGKIAWFGFGLRHIIDDLLDTEQGSACVALCGCLTSSYDVDFTSQVLRKLCEIKGAPTDLTPSIRQWTALVRICAGVLSNSQFPHLLTGFERLLDRYHQTQGCPTPPDPELLARAINTLGLLSKGNLRSVTYSGGLDCAWIAAMAQWMLSLGVEINVSRGNTLYRSKSLHADEIAQVIINIDASYPGQASSLTHKAFSIPQGRDLFSERDITDRFRHCAVRMAVSWTEILVASFGQKNMDSLFNAPGFAFALFLKTMSLIPNPVMHKIWSSVTFDRTNFPRRKSGMEFLEWAMDRLPELRTCLEVSLHELNGPLSRQQLEIDAKESLEVIRATCKCRKCSKYLFNNKPQGCLKVISITVLHYLFILSSLSIDESICPSCTGLRLLYRKNLKRYGFWATESNAPPKYTSLEQILEALTGQRISEDRLGKPASAISANGICIFYNIVLEPNASPLNISTIRVIPGHIEFENTHHVAIFDPLENLLGYYPPIYRKDEHPAPYSLFVRQKQFDMSIEVSYQIIVKSHAARLCGLYSTVSRLAECCTWQNCTTWCESGWHDFKASYSPNRPQGQEGTISDETPFQSRWLAVLLTRRNQDIGLRSHYGLEVLRFDYWQLYFDFIVGNSGPDRIHLARIRNCPKCLLMYALQTMIPVTESDYTISIGRENTEPVVVDVVGNKIGEYEVKRHFATHPRDVLAVPLFTNVPLDHDPQ